MRPDQLAAVLARLQDLLDAPLPEILASVSAIAADLLPHHGLMLYSGDCVAVPVRSHGDTPNGPEAAAAMTRLAGLVEPGIPWHGEITVDGTPHRVLAVAAAPPGSAGSVLAALPTGAASDTSTGEVLQRLWEIAAWRVATLNEQVEPVKLSRSHIEADDRARLVVELTDGHAAALGAVLDALRSRRLADAEARRVATDLAAEAMVELRTATGRDPDGGTETAGAAFATMADKLLLLMRYNDVQLELAPPSRQDQVLPGEIAVAGRAATRGAVLTALEQTGVGRLRIAWEADDGALRVTVRDDGPGELAREDAGVRRIAAGLAALGGELELDAVPGWGSAVMAVIPMSGVPRRTATMAQRLNPREIDVLRHLVRGHRNRRIAEVLHISEHTVKFHVANILGKLGVASRGEAAALARELGFAAGPPHAVEPTGSARRG